MNCCPYGEPELCGISPIRILRASTLDSSDQEKIFKTVLLNALSRFEDDLEFEPSALIAKSHTSFDSP